MAVRTRPAPPHTHASVALREASKQAGDCSAGQTWPHAQTLEPGKSAYSSLTTLADGRVAVLYEAGERGPPGWEGRDVEEGGMRLILARFELDWLTGGGHQKL